MYLSMPAELSVQPVEAVNSTSSKGRWLWRPPVFCLNLLTRMGVGPQALVTPLPKATGFTMGRLGTRQEAAVLPSSTHCMWWHLVQAAWLEDLEALLNLEMALSMLL